MGSASAFRKENLAQYSIVEIRNEETGDWTLPSALINCRRTRKRNLFPFPDSKRLAGIDCGLIAG